jgi:NADPH:quinone reductase-like Zn-dependent oxidoreductase
MGGTGGVDVLRWESVPAPEPADGQVLLRVHAAAVNPVDWKHRRGLVDAPLPVVPGSDVSGVVEVSRSADFAVGDAVCGMAVSGGYAELAAASERHLVHKPDGVAHERAAAVPVSGLTAWQALSVGGALQQGRTVVIAGAAGGVGHLAVQFATLAGAHVIGTGSERNRDFVLGLGAHRYVDYTRSDVAEAVREADVVVDTVGGATTRSLVPALRPGGTLVSIAYPTPADWPEIQALSRTAGVRAELVVMRPDSSQLQHIIGLVADGAVRVEIAAVYPLTDAGQAQLRSESGHTRGKLVLTVDRH